MAQKQILRKLYLTAFWGLTAFGIAVIGATTAFQGSEYVRDRRAVGQWEAEYGDEGWEIEEIGKDEAAALLARARTSGSSDVSSANSVGAGLPREETWKIFGPRVQSGWDRLGTISLSFLSLVPLVLLVLLRRWGLWLLRPEPTVK